MNAMMTTTPLWLLVIIFVILVIATVSAARRQKWMRRNFDVKLCPHCHSSQPPHAGYCRHCGQKLP
jgi:ribosomal protein L40E